ncbi:MAG TPA: response regulator [Ignavibacteria bacterium]|nr:response regulator [Ignavibacteria bacterium]
MNNKKILVVEDDGVLRDVLMEKLKVSGYIPLGAEDGEIAIEKIKTEKPDMILLDILMPKKDGMEVLEEMNADEEMKNIPVIVISNSGQPVEIERARSLGAKDFLVKAIFDPSEVLEKVEKIFNDIKNKDIPDEDLAPEFSERSTSVSPASAGVSVPDKTATSAVEIKDKNRGEILVVEDDKFLRELLVRKLFSEGFNIESAIDSSSAFEILSSWSPQIILLDLILPGEDGFSILEKIKKDNKLKNIPVIILSNLGQQEDIDRAMALGAMDFMVKANFTLDEIVEKVTNALGEE